MQNLTHLNRVALYMIAILFAIFTTGCNSEDADLSTPNDEILDSSDNQDIEDAPSDSEDDYYTSPRSYAVVYNLQNDYNVDSSFDTDDSEKLQRAIDDAYAMGGGKIVIPEGDYSFADINIKSNIHLSISSSAVIRPTELSENIDKNYTIFIAQSESVDPIENFSITSYGGGSFVFDLRELSDGYENIRCIHLYNVYNFEIENVCIEDRETVYAAIAFSGENFDNVIYGPRKGVIQNVENYNSIYGYGLIQIQYGQDLLFKNIYSLGGVTLRFESHTTSYYETSCIDYITRVVARDVVCECGHAAVMLSPHFIKNGWVDIRGIEGVDCESTLLIESGFVTTEQEEMGLSAGYFSCESKFRDISAQFSATEAQVHPKHFVYMVDELTYLLPSTDPWDAKAGPSIAVILHTADYSVNYSSDDITAATDFLESQHVVLGDDNPKIDY